MISPIYEQTNIFLTLFLYLFYPQDPPNPAADLDLNIFLIVIPYVYCI